VKKFGDTGRYSPAVSGVEEGESSFLDGDVGEVLVSVIVRVLFWFY
jgi:hypothetical protein